jgi:hypothetical protein
VEILVTDPERYPGQVLKLTLLDEETDKKAKANVAERKSNYGTSQSGLIFSLKTNNFINTVYVNKQLHKQFFRYFCLSKVQDM